MKGLLGFVVLTGPLWLIFLLFIFGSWLGFKVTRLSKSAIGKVAVGVGTFALVLFLPFADEIAGRLYLNYLCATKAGVNVYHTVELPAEYWDEKGIAKFYDARNGNFYLSKEYPTEWRIQEYSSLLQIDKRVSALRNQAKSQTFAEEISFMHWGGWIRRNLSPSHSAISCGNDLEQFRNFMDQAFKKANSH